MSFKLEVSKKYVNTRGNIVRIIADDKADKWGHHFVGLVMTNDGSLEQAEVYNSEGMGRHTPDILEEYDEYAEWKKLPVDAKILVSTFGPRYFHSFDSKTGLVYFYPDGKTSWSARVYNLNTYAKVENCTIVKD